MTIFPKLGFKAQLTDSEVLSPLLEVGSKEWMALDCIKGKQLYKVCDKAVNKGKLKTRKDTPWREHFRLKGQTKPVWGMLYKPPLAKNIGDLHWRVVHGIIAVNAFISIFYFKCPFCSCRETIFHCFLYCCRLTPLFTLLSSLFRMVKEKRKRAD